MRYNSRARTIVSLARFALYSSCCFALNFTNSKAFMSDKKLPVGDVLYVEMLHYFFSVVSLHHLGPIVQKPVSLILGKRRATIPKLKQRLQRKSLKTRAGAFITQ